ncbi:MAG: hypothetical protein QNL05_02445, partial [Gammaproteobacteria bacterium]|nr:hypothetical protein [Gammaproteobacteria bacterium]MDX2486379.1 hypothetical protein [Gammaproteobacteria bacterium]
MVKSLVEKVQTAADNPQQWLENLQQENALSVDVEMVRKAFAFRQEEVPAGDEQVEFGPLLEVARSLHDLQVDNDTLVAGILHHARALDEDRIDNIKRNFGT